ncbi:MAG: dihydromonapterin reductase [Gammaproteobacteria bacterium]|nr:dihydromonapterin reductase [Gammaproteobacteria bacterium]
MRIILITGVGQRLGQYLAQHFLTHGDAVIGTYRTERDSIADLRAQGADLYQVDFYHQQQTQGFINSVLDKYTVIDCLVHNASDWSPDSKTIDYAISHDVLQRMMTIHVEVPYQLNLAFEPLLQAAEGTADIIHITDYVASKGSKKHIAYAASKAAMENLTLSFAQRCAPNVKVNSIAPALLAFNEHDDEAYKAKARAKSLMQREGSFQEALDATLMLMSSNYITGRVMHLDGGRHLN